MKSQHLRKLLRLVKPWTLGRLSQLVCGQRKESAGVNEQRQEDGHYQAETRREELPQRNTVSRLRVRQTALLL